MHIEEEEEEEEEEVEEELEVEVEVEVEEKDQKVEKCLLLNFVNSVSLPPVINNS